MHYHSLCLRWIVRNIYVISGSEKDNEIAEGITMYSFACLAVATQKLKQAQKIPAVTKRNTNVYKNY